MKVHSSEGLEPDWMPLPVKVKPGGEPPRQLLGSSFAIPVMIAGLNRHIFPIMTLALLVWSCFALTIHTNHTVSFVDSVPIIATLVNFVNTRLRSGPWSLIFWMFFETTLGYGVYSYWRLCFLRSSDRIYKRFMLRLILTMPAFAGILWAGVIERNNMGGLGVAETLATSGVITSCLLTSTVAGRSASTMVVALLLTLLGLLHFLQPWAIAATLAGALVGQYPARFVRHRVGVVQCAALVIVSSALAAFVTALVVGRELESSAEHAVQAMLNGCLGAGAWFTLLTLMERPFELTTPLGLLELLDPTRPIIAQFAREAPGTFAHSIMVGHLAASAAEAIGADPLLCRVAAQYHDLGKMRRAQFFVENQSSDNVHDRIAPSLSALIVNAHVTEGEQMARELGLPPVISDIISQHHGTTLMRYFFHRASEHVAQGSLEELQHHYRYPGPKPQSKEAAIMMIADAVEAASRTLLHPTRDSIRLLINQIVDDRIADHQLDESPLTLRDIAVIRASLTDVVCSVLHQRVEYPTQQDSEDEHEDVTINLYEDFDPSIVPERTERLIVVEGIDDIPTVDATHSSDRRKKSEYPKRFGA